jgi:hypothetical protein
MSQDNLEIAYRAIDAINQRDLDAFLALMDEEVQSVPRLVAVEGDLHGHDGIRRWWDSLLDAFPDFSIVVVEGRGVGDVALITIRALGHGAGSAVPFDDKTWHASRWQRGRCVWWQVFNTEAEALEAAGLRE